MLTLYAIKRCLLIILLIAFCAGCVSNEHRCESFGYAAQTPEYSSCLERLHLARLNATAIVITGVIISGGR